MAQKLTGHNSSTTGFTHSLLMNLKIDYFLSTILINKVSHMLEVHTFSRMFLVGLYSKMTTRPESDPTTMQSKRDQVKSDDQSPQTCTTPINKTTSSRYTTFVATGQANWQETSHNGEGLFGQESVYFSSIRIMSQDFDYFSSRNNNLLLLCT